jgi:hypothetical protein
MNDDHHYCTHKRSEMEKEKEEDCVEKIIDNMISKQ